MWPYVSLQVDDEVAEYFLSEQVPPKDVIKKAIRRNVVKRTFSPVCLQRNVLDTVSINVYYSCLTGSDWIRA